MSPCFCVLTLDLKSRLMDQWNAILEPVVNVFPTTTIKRNFNNTLLNNRVLICFVDIK